MVLQSSGTCKSYDAYQWKNVAEIDLAAVPVGGTQSPYCCPARDVVLVACHKEPSRVHRDYTDHAWAHLFADALTI